MARCRLFADPILRMFWVSEAKLVEKGKDLAREHAVTLPVSAVAGGAKHIPNCSAP